MGKQKSALLSFLLFVAVTLTDVSCRSQSERATVESAPTDQAVSSIPPFQTKEPERYQATRTITTFTSGGDSVINRTKIARDGQLRRDESETPHSRRVVYLDLPNGRFILLPDEKLYTEFRRPAYLGRKSLDEQGIESSPDRLLHTEPIKTSYQRLGNETVNGRKASKYRVVVNSSGARTVSNSETLTWIDETLGLPIKSETTSPAGPRTVMELTDISLDADTRLFQIPEGYKRVEFRELHSRLGKNE